MFNTNVIIYLQSKNLLLIRYNNINITIVYIADKQQLMVILVVLYFLIIVYNKQKN